MYKPLISIQSKHSVRSTARVSATSCFSRAVLCGVFTVTILTHKTSMTAKRQTLTHLVRDICGYRNFIKSGGVTLSGGEPLMQPRAAYALLQKLKAQGFHTALDTAGSVELHLSAPVLDTADLVLLDIKALDDALCRTLTSKSPQNTLRTLEYLNNMGKPVCLRHVLVPGYTLDEARLKQLAEFLTRFHCIERVELLPFHKMGEQKWKALGRPYTLYNTKEPTADEVAQAKQIFAQYGFIV